MTTRPARSGSGWRRWAALGVLATLLAVLVIGGWWLRHPAEVRWTETEMSPDLVRGEAVWAPLYQPGPDQAASRTITVESVTPVVASGEADVEYFVCTWRRNPRAGVGFGVSTSYVEKVCRDLEPAAGATLDLERSARQELVMSLTPRGDGPVRVSGHEIVFSDGWQTGTEVIAFEVDFKAER